jgi:hypothetical protein
VVFAALADMNVRQHPLKSAHGFATILQQAGCE